MPPLRQSELPAVNRIFVDREEPQLAFEKAVHAIPSDKAILRVFYGIGGQGKTALCRELMRKTDPAVEPSYAFLRRCLLDLHGRPKTDPDLLLVWIRNGFSDAGVSTPCFDLALALAWEGTRGEQPFPKLKNPWLGKATSAAREGVSEGAGKVDSETITEFAGEAIGSIPGVGFVLKRLGNWVIDKGKRAWLELTREHLQMMYHQGDLKPAYELSRLLPWMLAQDLNYHLASYPSERFVLFVDEYERVADEGGASSRWTENPFDRHVRSLVQETNGLLAVFFSRERLPWGEDTDWRDDLKDNQHRLGGLKDEDADTFLKTIPIPDEAIRKAIIEGARDSTAADASVYPLMLDLQVEHWRALEAKGQSSPERFVLEAETFEARCVEIIERILRDYSDALQATLRRLSVARSFDRAAFEHVVKTFNTALPVDNFERLVRLSFVTKSKDGYLTLHNVVAKAIQEHLNEGERYTSTQALFEHFEARAKVDSHFDLRDEHVRALFEAAHLRKFVGDGYPNWLEAISDHLSTAAKHAPLKTLWDDAVSWSEKVLGAENPGTALSLNNLAALLQAEGDYPAARPLYERALAIREKVLGAEHPHTAASLNNLAGLLYFEGDYPAAQPLYERALAINEKVLGPEHPHTAASLNNLAGFLQAAGDYSAAQPLYARALAISVKVLGPEHPYTALSLNNLAHFLQAVGDYPTAKPLYERALAINEKVFGPEHPDTALSLNNLAALLQAEGDSPTAKPLYERALAIREKVLGPEHPDTALSLNNLAHLLQAEGDCSAAKPLYKRALAINQKVLGPEHPSTALSLNNLAGLLQDEGDCPAAKPLYKRALAINHKVLGPDHPDTALSLHNLAGLLQDEGDYPAAKPLYERALAINEKVLGPEHPSTAVSLNNLAGLLQAEGGYPAAKPLYKRALVINQKVLGPEHPMSKVLRGNLKKCILRLRDKFGS